MDYTNPQYWPQLKALSVSIDGLDYYQILNLPQEVPGPQVRQMYYQMSRALHPDRFYHLEDMELRAAVGKIYRRITEAYTVLKDDQKRKIYTTSINGPDRARFLRFNEQAEREQKKQRRAAQEVARTPQGKKMYQAAVLEMQKGNYDQALKNIKSAMLFESGNEAIVAFKSEIEAKKAGQ